MNDFFARHLLVTGALLLGTLPVHAATYYVSPSGNDRNSCTTATAVATPKRNVASGVACLAPGDTLYLRAGTYTGPSNVIDSARFVVPSGTSWASPVTIAGYPGEVVIIRPLDGLHGIRLTEGAPKYLIFQDFVVDMADTLRAGVDSIGIYLSNGAHHNRFQRLEVKNSKAFGIVFSRNNGNSPFNEVIDSAIHHTGNGSGDVRNGHGLYISTSDNLFEGNDIYDNEGFGFHLYDDDGPKYINRNIITRNTIRNNGAPGKIAYGIVLAHGADNLIYDNDFVGNRGGVLVYSRSSNAAVFNNRFVGNAPLEAVSLQYYESAPTVRNNVVSEKGSGIVDHAGTGKPVIAGNVPSGPGPATPSTAPRALTAARAATPGASPAVSQSGDANLADVAAFLLRVQREYAATEQLVSGLAPRAAGK